MRLPGSLAGSRAWALAQEAIFRGGLTRSELGARRLRATGPVAPSQHALRRVGGGYSHSSKVDSGRAVALTGWRRNLGASRRESPRDRQAKVAARSPGRDTHATPPRNDDATAGGDACGSGGPGVVRVLPTGVVNLCPRPCGTSERPAEVFLIMDRPRVHEAPSRERRGGEEPNTLNRTGPLGPVVSP